MEHQVSRAEAVGRVHLPDVRTEPRVSSSVSNSCARSWLRTKKLASKSKIDLTRLPPCHSALKPHLQWVNHHVALYKRADKSILEKLKPYDDGQVWIRTEDGVLEPVWSCGAALPNPLVNLLDTGDREEEKEEE